jgi:hypothetical protein
VCAGFIRALIREIREIRGCFIFCGFMNATEFLMPMNDSPPQELCGENMIRLWLPCLLSYLQPGGSQSLVVTGEMWLNQKPGGSAG